MKKPQTLSPLFNGALRGIGLIAIVGLGIVSFNHFHIGNLVETAHNASETSEEIKKADDSIRFATQDDLIQVQEELKTFQADMTLPQQIQQLQTLVETHTTLLTQLQSGQTNLENTLLTLLPLGTFIASNGTLSQTEMNALGRAKCDGSDIASQVPDATLKGSTLNLAGRSLIGEGKYAKDESINFTLGHVDEYTQGTTPQIGEVSHLLNVSEMPYHTHGISMKATLGGGNEIITIPNEKFSGWSNATNLATQPAGGDQPHNNMPPFHVVEWYVKVK
ncbi:MAG: hypothetical protein LBP53_07505 [Candidatus Peribacteria bacterium]|nr:hypothetical protein [Candidatus Peribacteria bacterium]